MPDKRALGGVVIQEYETIQTQIELFRHFSQVRRLIQPVRPEDGEIVQVQYRAVMLLEGQPGLLQIVLRAPRDLSSST